MTYSAISQSSLNLARRALGDTSNDAALELLTDAEIEALIDADGYNLALALLADGLSVRFAQEPGSVSLPSGLSVTWRDRVEEWRLIATRYRALAQTAATLASLDQPVSASVAHRVVW